MMEEILVPTQGGFYQISFGPQIWRQVIKFAADFSQVVVVSDNNVAPLYAKRLPFPLIVLEAGEEQKKLDTVAFLADEWAKRGLDRHSLVVALGGGVIGDLVGFAASVYQRGIDYLQIPTSLLAQVDSAVGGKTGVNTSYGKNLVGTFYQPRAVFIDPGVLTTLPTREITAGLGEVLKYGIIADHKLFKRVADQTQAFYELEYKVVTEVIKRCLTLKAQIVEADERETGLRRILNLGHTFGHALEKATDFKLYKHGEAVLLGIMLEARLANHIGLLKDSALAQIEQGLLQVKLDYNFANLPLEKILTALRQDKKNRHGKISFILPEEIGKAKEVLLKPAEVEKLIGEVIPCKC